MSGWRDVGLQGQDEQFQRIQGDAIGKCEGAAITHMRRSGEFSRHCDPAKKLN